MLKAFFHEPWRDEWGPWGVALDSASLAEMWENLRYGGHARLWHVAVLALQRAGAGFFSVQLLSAALATAAVWLVARYAPFTRWMRALFALGYYPLFEYSSIARPYCLALAAACGAAATFRLAHRNPWPLALCLVLLTQTTMYGVIVAAAVSAALAVSLKRGHARPAWSSLAPAALLVVAAALFAVAQMVPPSDSGFARGWHWEADSMRARSALMAPLRALAPMPVPSMHFWNTHVLSGMSAAAAGAGCWLLATLALARSAPALTLWLTASIGHLVFTYVKFAGHARHHGHLFLAVLIAAWVAARLEPQRSRAAVLMLAIVLGIHSIAGVFAVAVDAAQPFSSATQAAEALLRAGARGATIVSAKAPATAAVAAAFGEPFVLAGTGRTSTYVQWDRSAYDGSYGVALRMARESAKAEGAPSFLVLDEPLDLLPRNLRVVATTAAPIVRDEQFFVYEVSPP